MKFLQDDQLVNWTTSLTEVPIGHSRILNGRLEVYSMKRASSDKKYAAVLGEKYVEQIQQDQDSMGENNHHILVVPGASSSARGRKRSQSVGMIGASPSKGEKSVEFSMNGETSTAPPKKRSRSCSLDEGLPKSSLTALGDFNEQGTRRLMTDLVLTLNASFPDYDFASIKPTDFVKLSAKKAVRNINESLSEWASPNVQTSGNDLNQMWNDVDQAISLKECEVYKFLPPEDASFLLPSYDYEEVAASYGNAAVIVPESMETGVSGSSEEAILWSFSYLFVNKQKKRIVLFSCAELMRQQSVTLYSDDEENGDDRFVQFADTRGTAGNLDFDLDPESNTAGGIPISTI